MDVAPAMICVSEKALKARAASLPRAYLDDCTAAAKTRAGGQWCFAAEDYERLKRKYRGYAVSQADDHQRGERISGCCDRADQY